MKGRERNEPCWCRSGKKYKKCHLGRADQPRPTFAELAEDHRRTKQPVCLHPNAPSECEGKIVKAHTIQKSGGLTRIAREGHVYAGNADLGVLKKTGGVIPFQLIGINVASTFTGFCARHDTELFRPIETEPFTGSQEQLFLFHYRSFSRELFTKLQLQRSEIAQATYDRGLSPREQRVHQILESAQANSTALAVRDQLEYKRKYDRLLLAGDYRSVSGLVIEFDQTPPVLVSAALFPDFDFQGSMLQNFATMKRLDDMGYAVVPNETGGMAILSWIGDQPAAEGFVESLLRLPDSEMPDALLRFTFEYFENTFIKPDWWENLDTRYRDALAQRLNDAADVFKERTPNCLVDDSMRVASWKVTEKRRIQGIGEQEASAETAAPRYSIE
jgi:SEC-C motif